MSSRSRFFPYVFGALLFLTPALLPAAAGGAPDNLKIKIGVLLALSGPLTPLAQEVQRGVELAHSETGAAAAVAVVYEDVGSLSPRQAATAAHKLLDIDRVQLALSMIIEEAEPIIPIFTAKRVPLLVLWDSNKRLLTASEYVFSNGFSTEKSAEVAADYAVKTLKLKKIAILGHITPAVEILAQSFADRAAALGSEVIYRKLVDINTTEFKALIPALRKQQPDGVYFLLAPPFGGVFLKEAAGLQLAAKFLTTDLFTADSINTAGDHADGVYFTGIYADDPETLTAQYRARYHAAPVDITLVALGYDGMQKALQAASLMTTRATDPVQALLKVFGPTRSAARTERLFQVSKGQTVTVRD